MLRVYLGLLFAGMAAAAHASEEKGVEALISEPGQTTTRFVRSGPDTLFRYKPGDSGVMANRTAVVATAGAALGGSGSGTASQSLCISQAGKENAPATDARWSRNDNGNRILSLARHKRVEFGVEEFKVTLHQDSASIEAGHVKVGLRGGTTSMWWTKAL